MKTYRLIITFDEEQEQEIIRCLDSLKVEYALEDPIDQVFDEKLKLVGEMIQRSKNVLDRLETRVVDLDSIYEELCASRESDYNDYTDDSEDDSEW